MRAAVAIARPQQQARSQPRYGRRSNAQTVLMAELGPLVPQAAMPYGHACPHDGVCKSQQSTMRLATPPRGHPLTQQSNPLTADCMHVQHAWRQAGRAGRQLVPGSPFSTNQSQTHARNTEFKQDTHARNTALLLLIRSSYRKCPKPDASQHAPSQVLAHVLPNHVLSRSNHQALGRDDAATPV